MFSFFPRAKFVCPNHLLHFVVTFPIESGQIMLFLFFLAASTSEHRSKTDPKCGQGEEEANPMCTQWTHVDPDGKSEKWG